MHSFRHWLQRRRYPVRYDLLAQLLRNQSLSREQLLCKQQADFAAIVAFAAANTAYYAGIQLADLPILEKDAVRERLDDLLVRGVDRGQVKLGHTGGSTGKPLAFYYDDAKHELMRAGMMRSYMMSGWQPGEKILNFWGARLDPQFMPVFARHIKHRVLLDV